jgi:hypothetical protein
MFLVQVALVSESKNVAFGELARVSAALQKQALRDLGPIWDVQATVDAFENLEDVPLGYWPITVMDDIPFNAAGIHLDRDGQPFALVRWSEDWALTASHESVEMLVDPSGDRLIAGPSLNPDQGRVEYLVEVADPSEAAEYGYTVNGILVSDFYTQNFFDPVESQGVRYSYTGAIKRPRQVLPGGYISWHDPVSDDWWQQTWFEGPQPTFVKLGPITEKNRRGSLRATVDFLSVQMQQKLKVGAFSPDAATRGVVRVGAAKAAAAGGRASVLAAGKLLGGQTMRALSPEVVHHSSQCKAALWRRQISALVGGKAAGGAAKATTKKKGGKGGK